MSLQLSTSKDCSPVDTAVNMYSRDLPSREKLCVESADEFLQCSIKSAGNAIFVSHMLKLELCYINISF